MKRLRTLRKENEEEFFKTLQEGDIFKYDFRSYVFKGVKTIASKKGLELEYVGCLDEYVIYGKNVAKVIKIIS